MNYTFTDSDDIEYDVDYDCSVTTSPGNKGKFGESETPDEIDVDLDIGRITDITGYDACEFDFFAHDWLRLENELIEEAQKQ